MKTFLRVLSFVRPFIGLFFIAIFFNIAFAILSTVFIAVIHPVLQILFTTSTESISLQNVSLLGSLKNSFYSSFRSLVLVENQTQSLLRLCGFVVLISVFRNLSKYFSSVYTTKLNDSIVKKMRDTLFNRMVTLSMDFYAKNRSGDLLSLINNDVSTMHSAIDPFLSTIFRNPIEIALLLTLLLSLSPLLTLIAFSSSFLGLFVIRISKKYIRKYATRLTEAHANYTSIAQETIFGIRAIKAFGAEDSLITKFKKQTSAMVKDALKIQKVQSLAPSINDLVAIISLAVVLFIGGSQVFEGTMSGADVMQFLFALFAIMSPISGLTNIPIQMQKGIVSAERVFRILDTKETVVSGTFPLPTFSTSITIEDVSFAYREDVEVLKNVTLEIPKGKKVAFVGSSGSGKSTMLDLVIRFYDPTKGKISFDAIPIREFVLSDYRKLFGIVSQEPQLFNDTIRANICFGSSTISEEHMIQSATLANAHDFIVALPNGYDTIIGDRGILLSGGQKQRISIARALAIQPEILVFDEATSALDSESEKLVQEAINNLLENNTAIIVAHRLSTILACDCIYVFENGRIVEQGTHSELIEIENGVYKNLYTIQFAI